MSFSALWILMPLSISDVERFVPLVHPVLAEHTARPRMRELRRRWEAGQIGEADWYVFLDLAGACPLNDHLDVFFDVCDVFDQSGPHVFASARKGYPIAGLAHGLGPGRFAGLPGWFGDLLLSPDEVKSSLPAVEAVFALDEEERARVVERAPEVLVEGYNSDGIEAMVDGVVPVWRAAAETGQGLFATQVSP